MKITEIILSLTALLIAGCEDSNNNSPLSGIWVTESCDQASDINGSPVNLWLKALYEFTAQGTIRLGREQYSDSNCITLTSTTEPADTANPIIYQDHGSLTLQEGIEGHRINISFASQGLSLDVEAFYTINNGILCFSEAYTFEPTGFGVSQAGSTAIDFNNCLIKH